MIDCEAFYELLDHKQINFFTGVPDSLLKNFCAYLQDNVVENKNIVSANEGNALAIAAGYYLSTGKIGLVYMQNSGLGNIVNPLTSLNDPKVYGIPALLLIGWRGEPGKKDEPQHVKQGEITLKLLETLGIEYKVLSDTTTINEVKKIIEDAVEYMRVNKEPYALVVKKDTFSNYKLTKKLSISYKLSREEAINVIISALESDSIIVSTTGMASRELYELREKRKEAHDSDFLTVGSMGHASQIALGIALNKPNRPVYCLDGDGALIMHMGGLSIIGAAKPKNLRHIVLNNGVHDSVGGQPTVGFNICIKELAKACGYKEVFIAETEEELVEGIKLLNMLDGPVLLEIRVKPGSRKDLGRPTSSPTENKEMFMKFISDF